MWAFTTWPMPWAGLRVSYRHAATEHMHCILVILNHYFHRSHVWLVVAQPCGSGWMAMFACCRSHGNVPAGALVRALHGWFAPGSSPHYRTQCSPDTYSRRDEFAG